MKCLKFKEEAERLNVSVDAVRKTFEKSVSEGEIHGIIDTKNDEIIYYEPEELERLAERLNSQRVSIRELADKLNLKPFQVRLIINKLLQGKKIRGSYTYDEAFVPRTVMRSLVVDSIEETSSIKVQDFSRELMVPEEEIRLVLDELGRRIVNAIAPYRQIGLADLSQEASLPRRTTIALLKNLISEGKVSGFIDMANFTLSIEKAPTISKIERVPSGQIVEERVGKEFTRNQIIGLVVVVFIVSSAIMGGTWWYSLPKTATFTIRVESNTNWQGVIGSIEEGQRSIQGYGSKSYTVTGTVVSAVIQKQTEEGRLRVSILKDGAVIASQETSAAYGVVSVSAKS